MDRRKGLRPLESRKAKKEKEEREKRVMAEIKQFFTPPGPADNVDALAEEMESLLSSQILSSTTINENLSYEETDDVLPDVGFETPEKNVVKQNRTFDLYRQKGLSPTIPIGAFDENSDTSFESAHYVPRSTKTRSTRTIDMYKQKGVNPTIFPKKPFSVCHLKFEHDSISTMSVGCGSDLTTMSGATSRAPGAARYRRNNTSMMSPMVESDATPFVKFLKDFDPFDTAADEDYYDEATPDSYQGKLLRDDLIPTPALFRDPMFYALDNRVTSFPKKSDKKPSFRRAFGIASDKENVAPCSVEKFTGKKESNQVHQDVEFPPLELFVRPEELTRVPMEWLHLYANRPTPSDDDHATLEWIEEVLRIARETPRHGANPNRAYI